MKNKVNIYLDDVRTPLEDGWIVARDYYQFVSLIETHGLYNVGKISLDHDLGESAMIEYYNNVKDNYKLNYENIEEKTGYDCCKFLVNLSMDTDVPLPPIYVHSANPIGSHNMMGYINNYLKNCKLTESCGRNDIPHKIEEIFMLSPEAREARWKRIKK